MPRVKPGQRQRAKKPKTRSGCITCKVRRVKCDEAKPFCHRCTSTGRTCDGYSDELIKTPPSSHPLKKDVSAIKDEPFTVLVKPVSFSSNFESDREYRAFHFFFLQTHHHLGGFYDSEFWDQTILQASHVDPGIRHAIIALSSIHESYQRSGEVGAVPDAFALKQYSLAIREHLNHLDNAQQHLDQTLNYLAACMIFICIELLQAHYISAQSLVHGAMRILSNIPKDRWSASAWPLANLASHLDRLQSQAVGLFGGFSLGPDDKAPRRKLAEPVLQGKIQPPVVPKQFSSIEEARSVLEFYVNMSATDCENYIGTRNRLDTGEADYLLQNWGAAFDALIAAESHRFTAREQRAVAVLQMRRNAAWMSVEVSRLAPTYDQWAMLSDTYEDQYQHVVTLAAQVAKRSTVDDNNEDEKSDAWARGAHRFTLDHGIVGSLYDIACNCRNPRIRRQAVSVLREHACCEGMWDWKLATRVAERVIELEEAGEVGEVRCAQDVSLPSRIQRVVPRFWPSEQRAEVSYMKQECPSQGGLIVWRKEIIEW